MAGIGVLLGQDERWDFPSWIGEIYELFTNASDLLHRATHQRAYFEEITILLPKTWSSNIPSVPATSEMFDTANFIVTLHEHVGRESPYTNQFGSCGDEAEYTHLTDKFILDTEWTVYKYGDPGKVIVHEWGHLRWGLFDEYATNDKERFYLDQSRRVQATRCSEYVTGEEYDYRTGHRCNLYPERGQLPGSDCRFYPALDNSLATGSYMSMSYLESVADFCHSDIQGDPRSFHNPRAPSQQNIQCSYRSAWDVMLESEDFKNGNNPPRHVTDTVPTFHIVKSAPLRIVLLLDVSGSMSWDECIVTIFKE
ncbi:calcium-activated chloride channel regulator 4-like [Ptychodera flava]|uniref:calcium-activated chloride channel regulator 4-like n=1 Tax=Ptychodera flava TaxID=63121 RepID=UPI00396A9143